MEHAAGKQGAGAGNTGLAGSIRCPTANPARLQWGGARELLRPSHVLRARPPGTRCWNAPGTRKARPSKVARWGGWGLKLGPGREGEEPRKGVSELRELASKCSRALARGRLPDSLGWGWGGKGRGQRPGSPGRGRAPGG